MTDKQRPLVERALLEFALFVLVWAILSGICFGIDYATTGRFLRGNDITWAPTASATLGIIGFVLTLAHIFQADIKRFGAGGGKTIITILLIIILIIVLFFIVSAVSTLISG